MASPRNLPCLHPGCETKVQRRVKTQLCRTHYYRSDHQRQVARTIGGSPLLDLPEHLHANYRLMTRKYRGEIPAAEIARMLLEEDAR